MDNRGHEHDESHDHRHDNDLDPMAARVKAIETILVRKGLVEPAAIDAIIETYEEKVGPRKRRDRGGRRPPGPIQRFGPLA